MEPMDEQTSPTSDPTPPPTASVALAAEAAPDIVIKRHTNSMELYELISETVTGKLQNEELVARLNDLSNIVLDKEEFLDVLADVIVQFDVETNFGSKDQREILLKATRAIGRAKLLPETTCYERFEIDTLVPLSPVTDKRTVVTQLTRLRTRLYFKQRKYNLLREDSEGYAKLLTELSHLNANNCQDVLLTVKEIIGCHRICPNRVLDLVLEIFEYNHRVDSEVYSNFISQYYNDAKKITKLIILKLNFYATNKIEQIVPQSFYRLIATLLHREILDLDDIYPWLGPTDAKILDYHQRLVDESRAFSRKFSMVVTGDDSKPQPKTVNESLNDEDRFSFETDNHKVNICAHLIDIGDWEQGLLLAKKLPEYYCFSQQRVSTSACDLINYLIDKLYRECTLTRTLGARIRPLPARKLPMKPITTVEELESQILPMLSALGPFLSADTLLMTKIIRLLRHVLLQKREDQDCPIIIAAENPPPLYYKILDVINESILPAMSLSGGNSCLARELWTLIKLFKYPVRYKLYYNWRDEGSNPVLLTCRGHILLRAKHHMKRLSKETLRLTGRHLGKLCYSNPVITLNYILVQIQSYDNLIGLVVDALRFLPPLALDILIYCILEALSDPNKNKKTFDGMALAPWLTSLSTFSANIILRYKVEFTGFLEYIASQLRSGNSLDLVLLTDLIQKMTGIETMQAITDDRIEALMGGDVLRTEGAYFNQVKNTRKPSARLKDALIESRLAMPLCILMAQLRDSLFFNKQDETLPLKLIGKLYDQCQETLVQYGVFLSMNLSIDDYINFLPPLDKLMTQYKLDPDSAFFLARPMIFHKIKSKFLELKEAAIKELPVEEEGEAPRELGAQASSIKFVEAARSVINPIAAAIQPSLIEKYGTNNLNAKLFVIFWTLSMSDIEVPISCYEREIQRLKTTLAEFNKSSSSDDDLKRRKERERCNNLIQKLKQEQADQVEHTNYIKMYIESEKNNLFCDRSDKDNVYLESRQFVQHCPFARSILTASDAIYSARFLLYLHELKVEDYSTIICLDRLLCDLTYMMGACTENEANHYGRFLCKILKTTTHWHSDATIYNEECEQYPGSIIDIENSGHITYDNYREIGFKWHFRLTRAFAVALESNNYIQIRNALIVMISIIEYYPAIKHFGKGIGIKIEDVRNNEKDNRPDLYALATAYAGRLDEKKPSLIPESSFHVVDIKSSSSGTNTASSRPSSKSSSHRERHSSSSSKKRARHS